MTAALNPFGGPDPARVDRIAEEIGTGFTAGYSPIAQRHIFDPTLHPAILMAAIAKAHASGIAKIIASSEVGDRRQLVADIAAWIDAEVARA